MEDEAQGMEIRQVPEYQGHANHCYQVGERLRDERKKTVFLHGQYQITADRMENFKKRKVAKDTRVISPVAGKEQALIIIQAVVSLILGSRDTRKCHVLHPKTQKGI
jgi:hypothetical protein